MSSNQQSADAAGETAAMQYRDLKMQAIPEGFPYDLDANCSPTLLLVAAHCLLVNYLNGPTKPEKAAVAKEALEILEEHLGPFKFVDRH
ncbi:hypothetical protein [Methylocystis echinoides]|uniref:hypothetical protein n=1 Tax=Methylocystis echinoides TaxID=29468 RepID=UPI00341D0C0F